GRGRLHRALGHRHGGASDGALDSRDRGLTTARRSRHAGGRLHAHPARVGLEAAPRGARRHHPLRVDLDDLPLVTQPGPSSNADHGGATSETPAPSPDTHDYRATAMQSTPASTMAAPASRGANRASRSHSEPMSAES